MLLFYCTHCNKMIADDDSESTGQIVDRLDKHITKCHPATFSYEGTSNVARRAGLAVYDHSLRAPYGVRYGYTDYPNTKVRSSCF